MITTQKQRNLFLYPLNIRQSSRVFEQALREHAAVCLIPKLPEANSLEGTLASRTEESAWIAVSEFEWKQAMPLQSVCCDGELSVDGVMYIFATNILSVTEQNGEVRVEIALPEELSVVQRRRFSRTAMRESRAVTLSGASGDEGGAWSCLSSLLNLSVNGLACRVDQVHADRIQINQVLNISFRLETSPDPVECRGRLRSKTPAGSEGCVVLGFEFSETPDTDWMEQLRRELQSPV
jgi:c-di-GMP-binding flagellar brake protein YcgR